MAGRIAARSVGCQQVRSRRGERSVRPRFLERTSVRRRRVPLKIAGGILLALSVDVSPALAQLNTQHVKGPTRPQSRIAADAHLNQARQYPRRHALHLRLQLEEGGQRDQGRQRHRSRAASQSEPVGSLCAHDDAGQCAYGHDKVSRPASQATRDQIIETTIESKTNACEASIRRALVQSEGEAHEFSRHDSTIDSSDPGCAARGSDHLRREGSGHEVSADRAAAAAQGRAQRADRADRRLRVWRRQRLRRAHPDAELPSGWRRTGSSSIAFTRPRCARPRARRCSPGAITIR